MPYIKAGETTHWVVFYHSDKPNGATIGAEVVANIEADHTWLASFWTGVTWQGGSTSATKPGLFIGAGEAGFATWGGGYNGGTNDGQWAVFTSLPGGSEGARSGFIAEVTEEWEFMQAKGLATQPTEGSNGESLSQFMFEKWYLHINRPVLTGGWDMQNWLNGGREDGVNYSYGGDYQPYAGEVISGVVFLNYLNTQLGYSINQIIAAAAPTWTGVYRKLTGRTDNPFLHFMELLETKFPSGTRVDLSGVNDQNNPFPINTAGIKVFHQGVWALPGVLGDDPPVAGTPPAAQWTSKVAGFTVTFDGSTSTPGSAAITSFGWDFGDGSNDFGMAVTHTFAASGTFPVTLTVTDSAGLTGTRTGSLVVSGDLPVAEFRSTITGLSVAFDSALSKPGSGSIVSYAWDFGDSSKGSGPTPSHTYAASGTFNVILTITNSAGQTSSITHSIVVNAANAGYDYFGPRSIAPSNTLPLHPAGLAVAQALVHDNGTGEFWMTQVTANADTTSAYTENTRVSRMSPSGALLGQMILKGCGHGMTLNIDYQGSQPFVWVNWREPASGSTRTFDIVRFPFTDTGSTVQDRDAIANFDVMIPGTGSNRVLHIDWRAQRVALSTFSACSLYSLSDILGRGALFPLKTISTPYDGSVNTWQGLCTYNDGLFVLFGGAKVDGDADTTDPWQIREYSWNTGQLLKTGSLKDVGKVGFQLWSGGKGEVEGLTVYDPGDGSDPKMQFVEVTGVPNQHTWDMWQLDVRTQVEAASAAGFILRTTKPTTANVGAGKLRPVTNTVTPVGGVYTVSTAQTIKDTLINGIVVVKAAGVVFENCEITGPQTNPGTGSLVYIVNTDDPVCAASPPVFSYCSVYQKFNSPVTNAFSNRNVTVEYCDISNVVRAFTPTPAAGTTDCKITVRGSLIRDFVFYAGAGSGNVVDANLSTLSGNVVNGAYKAMAWTHCAAFKIDSADATGVNIYGNNILAQWSRSAGISMMPLPYDNNNDVVAKDVSAFVLNGGKNLIVEDNWLDGGGPTVIAEVGVTGGFARNRFGRLMDKPLGLTGTTATDDAKYQAIRASTDLVIYENDTANRNTWEDTGNVVNRIVTVTAAVTPAFQPLAAVTTVPWTGHVKFASLATFTVLQSVERKGATGHIFTSQAIKESNGVESCYLTRLNSTGTKIDTMILKYAGHGTSIDVELINGVEWVWLTWAHNSSTAGATNDIVRFPWRPGTYSSRSAVPGLQVRIPGNGSYRLVSFNWDDNYAAVALSSSNGNRLYRRYLASNLKNGTLGPQQGATITINDVTAPPTMQGFATWKNYFFHYRGIGDTYNHTDDPQQIRKYSWTSGALLQTIDVWPVNQPHLDGYAEPEGMSVSGSTLIFGQTNGAAGNRHSGYWTIPLA